MHTAELQEGLEAGVLSACNTRQVLGALNSQVEADEASLVTQQQ